MNHASLTARYRPQTFAEVAGQNTIKAILSRAAAEDRVAPAYLFSGTRGVGKTTIARIFAKALNCEHAPTAEPCNACESCRKITQGMAVDVVEIDGASNRGIEDAKRLKENIGYAPLEGRYKVFIIDEAHMLTRDAFNALLKTLEEPPARVTFFLATTEPHKFPVTIISRCQHFVFNRLSQTELEQHLSIVLNRERIDFEPDAVALIARRASGSVRDSMSLLGQVLALGEHGLTTQDTRNVLGLAGQDVFFTLLDAILERDCLAVAKLVRVLLDRGADIGFFLRELTSLWRNLFILAQSGENGLSVIDLPESEALQLLQYANTLPLAHIHACWQMTLEGQRRVLTSIEPAQALELLLLNLAVLPRLVPVQNLNPAMAAQPIPVKHTISPKKEAVRTKQDGNTPQSVSQKENKLNKTPLSTGTHTIQQTTPKDIPDTNTQNIPESKAEPLSQTENAACVPDSLPTEKNKSIKATPTKAPAATEQVIPSETSRRPLTGNMDAWDEFTAFCKEQGPQEKVHLLTIANGTWLSEKELLLKAASAVHFEQMQNPDFGQWLQNAAQSFRTAEVTVRITPPPIRKTKTEQREELLELPTVKLISTHLSATLLNFWDKDPKGE